MKREILGERIVKAIRFLVMEQMELFGVVVDCEILNLGEIGNLMKYFAGVSHKSVGFLENGRRKRRISMYTALGNVREISAQGGFHLPHQMTLSVKKTIELQAVRLFGGKNNKYDISLEVWSFNGYSLASETDIFTSMLMRSDMGHYHGIRVIFNPSLTLRAGTEYLFDATLKGPPTWYGEGGVREHDDLTISFSSDFPGGPFAELEYRLK